MEKSPGQQLLQAIDVLPDMKGYAENTTKSLVHRHSKGGIRFHETVLMFV